MVKTALLFRNYGPYHFARLAAFSQACRHRNWQSVGIELARSESDYGWITETHHLPDNFVTVVPDQVLETVSRRQIAINLWNTLSEIQPDVVAIAGYVDFGILVAFCWSQWHGKPAVLMSDSKADDAVRHWFKEWLKGWIVRRYRAAIVAGKPQYRYLTQLGMAADKIFFGFDVVGNATFHPTQIRSLPTPLDRPFFLTISRFVPKKNLLNLLTAYADYVAQVGTSAWALVLCGDGVLRDQIEQKIAELGLQDQVYLPGFLQQEELLPYFAHARCLIHASLQEQWGLVVNEAMAAGLPVLVSNRCGCYEDLVLEGINGFGFDPEQPQELSLLMQKMSEDAVNIEEMGKAALSHIQKFSPEYFADQLSQAIQTAIAHS